MSWFGDLYRNNRKAFNLVGGFWLAAGLVIGAWEGIEYLRRNSNAQEENNVRSDVSSNFESQFYDSLVGALRERGIDKAADELELLIDQGLLTDKGISVGPACFGKFGFNETGSTAKEVQRRRYNN